MSTTVEALEIAAADLRAATLEVRGTLSEARALKESTAAGTNTIINNFINRPASLVVYTDINNGTDAEGYGGSIDKPYKTADYAFSVTDKGRPITAYMLTPDTIRKVHVFYSTVVVIGIARGAAVAANFTYTSRRLSFAPEASNPGASGDGRTPGRLAMLGSSLSTFFVDLELPDSPAALDNPFCISMSGGALAINQATITVATAGAISRLIEAKGGQRIVANLLNVTLGANVPGKLFGGVAAGANPNVNWAYETNLTAA